MFQIGRESHLQQISINSSNSSNGVAVSSVNVYEVALNQGLFGPCNDEKCFASVEINWLARNEGQFSLICPVLDGNTCGDHGLTLNEESLCHQGVIQTGVLSKNQSLVLSLWYVPHALFNINCYLWATADGKLPATVGTTEPNEELAETLVRSFV